MTVKADVTSTLNGQSADLVLIEDGDSRNYETKALSGGSETFVFTSLDGGLDKEYTAKIVPSTTDVTATAEVNYGATVEIDPLPHRDVDADATIRETAEFNNGVGGRELGLGDHTLVGGLLTTALNDGEVLADDGYVYSTVQAAQDAASSWIFIGPGTFNESVTIDTAGLTIIGTGESSLVDGGNSVAIEVTVSDVYISNIKITTDNSNGSYAVYASNSSADYGTIESVKIDTTGDRAIFLYDGSNYRVGWNIINSDIINSGGNSAVSQVSQGVMANCRVENADNNGVGLWSDAVVANNLVINCSSTGMTLGQNGYDGVCIGNRIIGSGDDGISISGADNIIANNRVSGSTNQNIDDNGTNTILDGNNTGAAN